MPKGIKARRYLSSFMLTMIAAIAITFITSAPVTPQKQNFPGGSGSGSGTVNSSTLGKVTCYNVNGTIVSGCPDITDRSTPNGTVFSTGLSGGYAQTYVADGTIGASVPVKLDTGCVSASGCVIAATTADASGIIGFTADNESATVGLPIRVIIFGLTGATPDNTCSAGNSVINSPTVTGQVHCVTSAVGSQILGTMTSASSAGVLSSIIMTPPGSSGSSINTVNVSGPPYNAPIGNSCASGAVHITSGSNSVTCDNYTFTSADVGKIIFETCCGGAGGAAKTTSAVHLAQGIINAVSSAHVVTVCTTTGACTPVNATATDNGTTGAVLIFGNDATAAMTSAVSAAYGVTGPCPGIQLPVGLLLVKSSFGSNATPTCTAPIGNSVDTGVTVFGQGRATSIIVPTIDFNFATCTGLGTQPGCFFSIAGIDRKNFGIWGGEVSSCTGAPHTVSAVTSTTDDFDWNLGVSGWCAQDTSMWGYLMEGPGAYPEDPVIDGAGGIGLVVTSAGLGAFNNLVGCFVGDTKGSVAGNAPGNVWVKSGATLSAEGCMWGTPTTASQTVLVEGTFYDTNGVYLVNNTSNGLVVANGGIAKVSGIRYTTNAAINGAFIFSGGKLFTVNSQYNGAASTSMVTQTGAALFDLGGNVFTSGQTIAAGTLFGSASVTGTTLIATNVTPNTNWGTSGAAGNGVSAPLGDSHLFTFTITAAGVPAANPQVAIALPTAYLVAPGCSAQQIGGSGAIQPLTTTTGPSTTAVTFTWNGTPVAASTYIIQGRCQ